LFDELADQGEVELVGTNSTSWLGVPLKTPNGIIGVIGVQDYENSNRYSERDKDFLASIGSQVAVAIERKRAEEELHHSEARFKILFENSPISLWEEDYSQVKVYFDHLRSTGVTDFQDYFDKHPEAVKKCASLVKVLDVNRATLDLMQVEDKSELLGGLSKSLYEDAYPYFKSELISLANGNLSFESDEGIMLKDGSSREVFFSLSVVSGYAENLGKVLVSILDITERKQAEQDLRLSEERFLQLANNIQEVFWITDAASGEDIYISPASKTIWGRSVETMLHDSNVFLETIQPEDRPAVVRTIEKQRGGENTEIEYRITLPDGSVRWVWDRAFPVFDEEGRVVRLAGIAADITERKQNERETTRHLIELEALYENGLAVSRLLEPAEIGRQVIETFAKHLSWHHATIRLRKNKDDLALIALNKPGLSEAEKNEMVRHFNSMVSQVGEGLSGFVVQTGTPIRSGDVRSHPKYIETQANIQSGLYMPLKIGERVLGVISVESERPDAFSPEDERLLATLANQATIAFENATLYQAARQEIAERLRVENALRTSETHYRDLANSITDIMFEIDENLQFTHWNKSSGLLTGIPEEKALGKTTREIFGDSSEAMEVEKAFLSVLSNRVQRSFESPLRLNGGQYIYEINAYPSTNGISR
jgi:PAS domain S-box-containing protein